jgi:hypothetical protein
MNITFDPFHRQLSVTNAVIQRRCICRRTLPWITVAKRVLTRLDMDAGACAYAI